MEEGARSEARSTGLKTLLMEEIGKSIRVLNDVSGEILAAENHEGQHEVVMAMTRVLGWLHRQIGTPPLRTEASYRVVEEEKRKADLSTWNELSQVFLHWHKLQMKTKRMNWRLWVLWTELGCALEVLQCCEKVDGQAKVDFAVLLINSSSPTGFPTSKAHCNKEKQVAFTRELWDAVVAKPLYEAPVAAVEMVIPKLVEVYLHWMAKAMRGYEAAFIANVASPLRGHLSSTSASNTSLADAWLKYTSFNMSAATIPKNAGSLAIAVIVLAALTSTQRSPEVVGYLEALSAAAVDELSRGPFPQPHTSVAMVAMALGLTALDDAGPASNQTIQLQSGNTTLLCQFALLRLLNLPILSPRLKAYEHEAILEYQKEVTRRMRVLVQDASTAVLHEYSLRMAETCIEEIIGFFQTSLETYFSFMEAVQSVLPADLFRLKRLRQLQASTSAAIGDDHSFASASDTVAFLKQFYGGVAPILEILSTVHLVRGFLALSRVEFVREVCASPSANVSMQAVTQQLEQALEQTATPPDAIFAPVLRALAMHSMTTNRDIPPEVDMVAGCQALTIGLLMQRKLRVLLFQCTPLIDDALAVVFSALYNVFEPADAFAHRFLGVCLTHLGQFTPLFTVFPHYLQVTLAAYPNNASRPALTKACGAIFGSLFYSEALTAPAAHDKEVVETAQRMVLWAIRKSCERSTLLLVEEEKGAAAVVSTGKGKVKAGDKDSAKNEAVSTETDGLYLAGLVFELMKMAPLGVMKASAMETEQLLARWKSNPRVLRALKSALFARISQNCEAEKRAWLAAWYIELDKQYPTESSAKPVAASRL